MKKLRRNSPDELVQLKHHLEARENVRSNEISCRNCKFHFCCKHLNLKKFVNSSGADPVKELLIDSKTCSIG